MDAKQDSIVSGVRITPLKIISDERGAVLHMLRSDSDLFNIFGEVYFSEVNPGVIKGWKSHREMTQNFAVPVGNIKLVIYDNREQSGTYGNVQEIMLGRPDHYCLVQLPPMLWYGFQNVGDTKAILANCADTPHTAGESDVKDIDSLGVDYVW